MQRPSSRLISEFGLVEQFQSIGINAVVNLQVRGEHPLCGDGINDSGFSYHSEEFMNHGIYYYNLGWTDMGVPKMETMMAILQIISFSVVESRKKVSIHCHAGYGRTGLVIGCWLVYAYGLEAEEAIKLVRTRRPGCIQTRKQKRFVIDFASHIAELARVFVVPPCVDDSSFFTVEDALKRQNSYLHGEEKRVYKVTPKIVSVICDILTRRARGYMGAELVALSFVDLGDAWGSHEEDHIRAVKLRVNRNDWHDLESMDVRTLAQLLLDWLDTLKEPLIPEVVTSKALADPTNIVVEDFHATPLKTIATLHVLFRFLSELDTVRESLIERVYIRFAYALMHPSIDMPRQRPFRTLRKTVDVCGTEPRSPGYGLVSMASFSNDIMALDLSSVDSAHNNGGRGHARDNVSRSSLPALSNRDSLGASALPSPDEIEAATGSSSGGSVSTAAGKETDTKLEVKGSKRFSLTNADGSPLVTITPRPPTSKRRSVEVVYPPLGNSNRTVTPDTDDGPEQKLDQKVDRDGGSVHVSGGSNSGSGQDPQERSEAKHPQHSAVAAVDDASELSVERDYAETFGVLCLLGRYVGLLTRNWDEFSAAPVRTISESSVGVAGTNSNGAGGGPSRKQSKFRGVSRVTSLSGFESLADHQEQSALLKEARSPPHRPRSGSSSRNSHLAKAVGEGSRWNTNVEGSIISLLSSLSPEQQRNVLDSVKNSLTEKARPSSARRSIYRPTSSRRSSGKRISGQHQVPSSMFVSATHSANYSSGAPES